METNPISIKIFNEQIKKIISSTYKNALNTGKPVISRNLQEWNIYNNYNIKDLFCDLKLLSLLYLAILTRLRSGHIQLNLCLHQIRHRNYYQNQYESYGKILNYLKCEEQCCINNQSGKCGFCCDQYESVQHYLMECKQYTKLRFILYCRSMMILNKYQLDFKLQNLLFPNDLIHHADMKLLYEQICSYVINTKRIFFNIH